MLEHWGVVPLFTAVVLGITLVAIVFAAIVWHHQRADVAAEPALPLPSPARSAHPNACSTRRRKAGGSMAGKRKSSRSISSK